MKRLVNAVQNNPGLGKSTAIVITSDEGGGYYGSGYIQPVDFFGDGPRVPLIVVSPYFMGGRVVHEYDDHASIAKFTERNRGLKPLRGAAATTCPPPPDGQQSLRTRERARHRRFVRHVRLLSAAGSPAGRWTRP